MEQSTNNTTAPVPLNRVDKDGNVDTSALSPADQQRYTDMAKSLVPGDANSILNYGVEVQTAMEKYSNEFLTSVRTFNSGDVGNHINELLTELNYIDVDELNQSAMSR